MSNLQTAEGLLQQHQQDGAHHQEQLQDLQLQVQQLQQQCQALRSRHQAATLELEEARAAGQEHEACWREKVRVTLGVGQGCDCVGMSTTVGMSRTVL